MSFFELKLYSKLQFNDSPKGTVSFVVFNPGGAVVVDRVLKHVLIFKKLFKILPDDLAL